MSISSDKTVTTTPISNVSRKRQWTDLDLSLTKHPIKKDISTLKDDAAIKNAVKNLILTNFYERPFQHEKGSNLRGLMFEPASFTTAIEIKEAIKDVLEIYESRVFVKQVLVQDNGTNGWIVNVYYIIKNIQFQDKVNIVLERLR